MRFISNLEKMQKKAMSRFSKMIGTTMRLHLAMVRKPKRLAMAAAIKKNNSIKQMVAFSK